MMDLLFWIYLINASILICHEIDSAYWQEWELIFPDVRNGINGFLILHLPVVFTVLLGAVLLYEGTLAGMIISLALAWGGMFAFFFHFYHIRKGSPGFSTIISKGLIISTFAISVFQMILTAKAILE
jgi:hypothetical protein